MATPLLGHLDPQFLEIMNETQELLRQTLRTGNRLTFPVTRPGQRTTVRVDMQTGATEVEREITGRSDAAIYLHKMPGPHNASVRGNWLFMRIWGWLADTSVYLVLFSTASGVYLWFMIKAERKIGVIFLASGVVWFAGLVAGWIEQPGATSQRRPPVCS